ncbi:MAG: adenylyltransferase/cytidyltransferase family protein [Candidatus Pacebacteria bacterium]|nr:adenylyltransferase/cytidyltransferase family protein [Candidatus Paceibacterota bacterium]PIR60420.1 MAG: D-glycero-beta-D-manno-heptose 1-phosphate adenylyltransferase [Candidatus Pacebacteria bacterium CG10_big_fil_rev_8_21_14_0_10_44_54]
MTLATTRTYQDLPDLIAEYRRQHKKIVLTQGTFDMLHIGHARYLKEAKSYGDVLIVGVDSDEKVSARKGPDRPIVPEAERLEMLGHLNSVDHVVLKPQTAKRWALIKLIQPDALIATKKTYTKTELEELKKYCQKIVVLEPMATTSTSAKLRLVQVGAAKKIEKTLSTRLVKAIEEVLLELKTP